MARKFYTPIDLTGLELQNAKIQNLASDPSPYGKGHTYFNTVHNELRVYDGTQWVAVGSALEYGNTASRPVAGNAGRAYADTQANILYVDNGTSWVQLGVSFTGAESLSNKTFQGPTYFQSGGGAGGSNNYLDVDNSTGKLTLHSGYGLDVTGSGQVTITSGGNNILLNPDGFAYVGSIADTNRIATLGDITSSETMVYGTDNEITVSAHTGNVTISLPDYIDKAGGEFHIRKTEYWLNESEQFGVVTANPYSGHFNVVAVNRNLELETQNGYDILLNSSDFVQVTGNTFNVNSSNSYFRNAVHVGGDAWNESYTDGLFQIYRGNSNFLFNADADADKVEINDSNNNNKVRFKPGNSQIELNNWTYLVFNGADESDEQGEVYGDGGLYVWSPTETGIWSDNRVYLQSGNNANIDIYPSGSGAVNVHGSQNVRYDLRVGGLDSSDGYFYVQNSAGTPVFSVDSGNAATNFVNTLQGFKSDGTHIISIHQEGGNEAIIEANNGDLILVADGYSYLTSNGSDSNRIATFGDVQAAVTGLTWKDAANLLWDDPGATLSGATGTLIIDGHGALSNANNGYRILITSGDNAGIWTYTDDGDNWTLARSTDADTYQELKGASIFIEEGTKYGKTSWVQSNHYLTDFTGQNWVQFSGTGTYTAGNGIAIDGQEISVHKDDTLKFTAGALGLNYGDGLTTDMSNKVIAHLGTGLVFDGGAITNDTDNGYGVRKFAQTIGNGSDVSFDCYHNFGTNDVTVTVYDTTTKAEVFTDVTHDLNKVNIQFADAPTSNQFRVVVVG